MIASARAKLALRPLDLLIRGMLSGALLAAATSRAFTAMVSTGQPLVGAVIFPVGLVIIVLLGVGAKVSLADWWLWNQIPVTLGNLIGGFVFTGLALREASAHNVRQGGLRIARRAGPGRIGPDA